MPDDFDSLDMHNPQDLTPEQRKKCVNQLCCAEARWEQWFSERRDQCKDSDILDSLIGVYTRAEGIAKSAEKFIDEPGMVMMILMTPRQAIMVFQCAAYGIASVVNSYNREQLVPSDETGG